MQASPGRVKDSAGEVAVPLVRARRLVGLEPDDALALLATVPFGRVVFTYRALPAIRLVNHAVTDGLIIIRTRLTSKAATAVADQLPYPMVVAYEADDVDAATRLGWSVVVSGLARPVTDDRAAQFERLLDPWVDQAMDTLLTIQPEIITGFRLAAPA